MSCGGSCWILIIYNQSFPLQMRTTDYDFLADEKEFRVIHPERRVLCSIGAANAEISRPFNYLQTRAGRSPSSAIFLQRRVSKAPIAKIAGGSLPPFTALSRQGGYAHTLKAVLQVCSRGENLRR